MELQWCVPGLRSIFRRASIPPSATIVVMRTASDHRVMSVLDVRARCASQCGAHEFRGAISCARAGADRRDDARANRARVTRPGGASVSIMRASHDR